MEALKKEIKMLSENLDKNRQVTQIHYGGGTPNSIPSSYIREINEFLLSEFRFIEHPEIAIECHPAYLDEDYIKDLVDSGFNRFSLGIQDFNEDILNGVNREPSKLPVVDLLKQIRNYGQDISVNMDFIYGLPGQTIDQFVETIDTAINLKPDRLVTFSYAHVPWIKKHQQILEKRGLPNAEEKIGLFLAAYDRLKDAGYQPIGLDHYVLPDDELYNALENNLLHRNFQGYCTRSTTGQVYAFGASSISQLARGYIQNVKDPKEYINQINQGSMAGEKGYVLTDTEMIIREAITDLMCNKKLNWSETAGRVGIDSAELKNILVLDPHAMEGFQSDGLITYSDREINLTERGSLFIRNIAASLDPAFQAATKKYSKSV
jgi:oxygen-independent coproporphyrinogen-3 oxidase